MGVFRFQRSWGKILSWSIAIRLEREFGALEGKWAYKGNYALGTAENGAEIDSTAAQGD
jgi:hypothetical protein